MNIYSQLICTVRCVLLQEHILEHSLSGPNSIHVQTLHTIFIIHVHITYMYHLHSSTSLQKLLSKVIYMHVLTCVLGVSLAPSPSQR